MSSPSQPSRRLFLYFLPMTLAPTGTLRGGNRTGAAYAEAVLKDRPAAYWRLGEKHGPDAVDSSGHGHVGHYHGKPAFGEPGAIEGDVNTSIRVGPPDSYVEIASSAEFSQPYSGMGLTVEAWMKPDVLTFSGESIEPYVMWLGKGEKDQMEWGFRFYSGNSARPNRIAAYVWNAEGGLGSGAYFQDALKAGEWMHIVATFSPGTENTPGAGVSIYRNGQRRGGPATQKGALYSAYNVRPRKGPAPVRLGTRDFGSFFSGGLDEVAIYPRKLTDPEIREHFRVGTGG